MKKLIYIALFLSCFASANANDYDVITDFSENISSKELPIQCSVANSVLHISSTEILNKVTITDTEGNMIVSETSNLNEISLNIQSLQSGIYLVEAITPDGKKYFDKFIVE